MPENRLAEFADLARSELRVCGDQRRRHARPADDDGAGLPNGDVGGLLGWASAPAAADLTPVAADPRCRRARRPI